MSKTYRRTAKQQKRDWLPKISRWDIETNVMWRGIWLHHNVDCSKQRWIKNNPHRNKDVDDYFYWMHNPRWWDRLYSTKPARAETRKLLTAIKKDAIDSEQICWPEYKRPVLYYW